MRIDAIELTWFRGAADTVTCAPKGKSIVVYGENGSGKSCFVDALEHVLNNGKIKHLSHEHSGKRQEKGIINTHTPKGGQSLFRIKFKNGSQLETEFNVKGAFKRGGSSATTLDSWDYRRTILRQDEVSDFIKDTKGGKYSALLPLLGFGEMEIAAENLRQLVKTVKVQSKLDQLKCQINEVSTKRMEMFGNKDKQQIAMAIKDIHKRYCNGNTVPINTITCCSELKTSFKLRTGKYDDEKRTFITLQTIASLNLKENVDYVRTANEKLAGTVEQLNVEKLNVLLSTSGFIDKLKDQKEVECPACGRSIPANDFIAHVSSEKERLKESIASFNNRKRAISSLCDTIKSLKSNLGLTEVKTWRSELAKQDYTSNFVFLDNLSPEALRVSISEDDLKNIGENLLPMIDAAERTSKDAPPDVQQLLADERAVMTGKEVIEAWGLEADVKRIDALVSYLGSLERSIRDAIIIQSGDVIKEITTDIQVMWRILHPGEPIEDVRLYVPEDTDKAIDIGLKFHGVEQNSPRLTLSEGHRNSLGLCIFLAMAKREVIADCPLFLDDVVVSLDRNHRGMISDLLENEFGSRQIFLFTHDRDWYIELRHQLNEARWSFKSLKPYETPDIGIRWSDNPFTFDDARAQLKDRADSAGNTARKIMDTELAILSDRLKVLMPYMHRERNDHRMAHDFLKSLISSGENCFKSRGEKNHEPYMKAIEVLRYSDKLLLSWGNKASHTFDTVKNEADKLITACECALSLFKCKNCGKPVHSSDNSRKKFLQCDCGHLRWHYGKN